MKAAQVWGILGERFGFPLAAIPLQFGDSGMVRATSTEFCADSKFNGEHLPYHIAHEIFRWVVSDHGTLGHSTGKRRTATLMRINSLLHKELGFDVPESEYFVPHFHKYSASDIAEDLPENLKVENYERNGFPHPAVIGAALKLRKKLHDKDDVASDLFEIDDEAETLFITLYMAACPIRFYSKYNIESFSLLRDLWAMLYFEKPKFNLSAGEFVDKGRAIALAGDYEDLRHFTVSNPSFSFYAAFRLVMCLDDDGMFLYTKIANCRSRIDSLKVRMYEDGEDRAELTRKINRTQKRLDMWQRKKPLSKILDFPSKVYGTSVNLRPDLKNAFVSLTSQCLPRLARTPLVERVRSLFSQEISYLITVADIDQKLTQSFGLTQEFELQDFDAATIGKIGGNETGLKDHAVAIQQLNLSYESCEVLEEIYSAFTAVDTMLSKMKSSSSSTDDYGQDVLLEYSNDATRAVAEELALLGQDHTKLLFLSRLAQFQLLSLSPQNSAKSNMQFLLDGSGSMHGRRYTSACGFILAVAKWMRNEGRGFALQIFSTQIDRKYVSTGSQKLKLSELLKVLTGPKFAGTDFTHALTCSQDLIEELEWKTAVTMMVTDGEDTIPEPELILSRKGKNKIIGVLARTKTAKSLSLVCDKIYNLSGDETPHLTMLNFSKPLLGAK